MLCDSKSLLNISDFRIISETVASSQPSHIPSPSIALCAADALLSPENREKARAYDYPADAKRDMPYQKYSLPHARSNSLKKLFRSLALLVKICEGSLTFFRS